MSARSKGLWVAAVLFTVVNLAGAVMAAWEGEALHAALHVALACLGAYGVQRLAPLGARRLWPWRQSAIARTSPELTNRLSNLEASVDAVAIEVERIGEGQRFMTQIFTDTEAPRSAGTGEAPPPAKDGPDAAPRRRPSA